jgi:hypothetical protein
VVARLFSVDRAEETWSELSGLVDLDYAWENLAALKGKSPLSWGEKANYPFYAGENSAVYAVKRAA